MRPASVLIDKVRELGGSIVLVLHFDRPPELELDVPRNAGWLIEAIRRSKPEIVDELRRRYMVGVVLSERVQ